MVLKAAGISAPYRTINYAAQRSGRRLRILTNPAPATISQAYASAAPRKPSARPNQWRKSTPLPYAGARFRGVKSPAVRRDNFAAQLCGPRFRLTPSLHSPTGRSQPVAACRDRPLPGIPASRCRNQLGSLLPRKTFYTTAIRIPGG